MRKVKSISLMISTLMIISLALIMTPLASAIVDGTLDITEDYVASEQSITITVTDDDLNTDAGVTESIIVRVISNIELTTSVTGEGIAIGVSEHKTAESVDPGTNNQIGTDDITFTAGGSGVSVDSVSRNTDGTVTITLSGTTVDASATIAYTAAETAELTETDVDTGIFSGSKLVSTSDDLGTLHVADGNTIEASYYDTDNPGAERTGNNKDSATADTSAPTLVSAATQSTTTIGVVLSDSGSGIDKASIEKEDFSVQSPDYTVSSIDTSGVTDGATGSQTVTLTLASVMGTGDTSMVSLTGDGIKDKAGNTNNTGSTATSDGVPPVIISTSAEDTTNNGYLDKITLTMSEDLTSNNPSTTAFTVTDEDGTSLTVDSVGAGGAVTLTFTSDSNTVIVELDDTAGSTGQPTLSYSYGEATQVQDLSEGNLLQDVTDYAVTDSAKPYLMSAKYYDTNDNGQIDEVKLNFSETLADYTFNSNDWTLNANNITGLTLQGKSGQTDNTIVLNATADENITGAYGGTQANVSYDLAGDGVVEDDALNEAATNTVTFDDMAQPVVQKIQTGDTIDTANTAYSSIIIQFTEHVTGAEKGDFTVNNNSVTETSVTDDKVTLTLGTALNSGATPGVSYTSDGGTDSELQGEGGNLVDNFESLTPTDWLKPTLDYVRWTDTNNSGHINYQDELKFVFSEAMNNTTVTASNVNTTLSVDSKTYGTSPTVNWASDNVSVTVTLGAGANIVPTDTVDPTVSVTDVAGNAAMSSPVTMVDIPDVLSVKTMDTDNNGYIDAMVVTFTEDMDESTAVDSKFDVADHMGETVVNYGTATDPDIKISFTENMADGYNTDTTPSLTIQEGAIKDMGGTSIPAKSSPSDFVVSDGAAPVLLHATINSERSDGTNTWVTLRFSEPMDPAITANKLEEGDVQFVDTVRDDDVLSADSSVLEADTWLVSLMMDGVLQTGEAPRTAVSVVSGLSDGTNSAVTELNENIVISTFRRTLSAGWSYVSFPIADHHEYNIGNYFSDVTKVEVVWTYADGTWVCYDPDPDQADKIKVKGGFGYLVQIKSGETLTLSPNVYNKPSGAGAVGSPVSRSVYTGWNLIGQYQEFDQATGEAFDHLTTIFATVYGMDDEGLISVDEMLTGHAYWAFANADGIYAEGSGVGT